MIPFKKIISPIFLIVIFCLIVSSLLPQEIAHKYFYQAIWFKVIWGILSVGLFISIINSLKRRSFSFAMVHLGIILILAGGFLGSLFGVEGFIEAKEGQSADGFWIEDDLFQPLDFSIFLKDFSVEFYPEERKGMRFVKSYKSSVSINKGGRLVKEGLIEVNKPLNFAGFGFYQYGYDEGLPGQTILQVVKDPGLGFVYAGYIVLLIGMAVSFKRVWKI